MMKIRKSIIAALAVAVLLVGLSGCKNEGPVERAGKKIDKTVEQGGEQIEKAGKKIQEDAKGK
jgi:predicted small secreted protein